MQRDKLLLAVYAIAAIFLSLVIISIQYAPVFTIFILLICTTVVLYVLTEHWKTHDAIEFENRFWSLMAGILAWSCVFCSDSPFRISQERSGFAWFFVVFSAYVVHLYDRHLRSNALKQIPVIPRANNSQLFDSSVHNSAKAMLAELRGHQERLDNKYISSFFQNIFNIRRVLHLEHEIIQIFSRANEDELNIILSTAELGLLFYKIKDHRVVRFFNRTAFLKLLCVDRIDELNVIAKVMLLDGIQKMKLSAHAKSSSFVKNIILSTKGNALSELKCLCDCKGDVNSFHKLVFRDVSDEGDRQEILEYIAKEAKRQRDDRGRLSIDSRSHRGKLAWRKVISDVDDTLTCSGGTWPAGIDACYPRKTVYPGVLAFYRELDLGFHSNSDAWDRRKHVGNLVFLSARPHVYKDVSEVQSYKKFRDLQEKRDLYTSPTLLAGSLEAGRQYMVRGNIEPVAQKKYSNLKEYLAIYPEYSCMYVGDNGQGDVRTAEMMFDEEGDSCMIERCYIHQVQPLHRTHTAKEETRTVSPSSKFFFFSTYVDAAVDAFEHRFIGLSGLKSVMVEAVRDFHLIKPEQWRAAEETSLSLKVNTTSTSAISSRQGGGGGSAGLSTMYRSTSTVVSGVRTSGTSGTGGTGGSAVTSGDNTIDDKASDSSESSSQANFGKSKYAHQYRRTTIVQVFNPELKIDARIREMNVSLMKANAILVRENLEAVPLLQFRRRFARGTVVRTLYGIGVVQSFRNTDGIYEILVQWDASGNMKPVRMFLQGSSIKPAPLTLNPSAQVRRFRASASTVQVTIPTAVSKVDLSWDKAAKPPRPATISAANSNRSSPATTLTASTSATTTDRTTTGGGSGVGGSSGSVETTSLTLGAVARHNILTKPGKKSATDGGDRREVESSISSTTSTINRMNPADVPLDKALEMAFLPNALARATGRGPTSSSTSTAQHAAATATAAVARATTITNRPRTMSETSDDMQSSNLGEAIGRYRSLHPDDRLASIRGSQVWTSYGLGHVQDYREKDDVIVVKLDWNAVIYAPRGSVVQLTDPRHTTAFQMRILKELDDDGDASLTPGHSESVLVGASTGDPPRLTAEPPSTSLAPLAARKPSMFPGWLGFWGTGTASGNGDKNDSEQLQGDQGVPLACGVRFDISADTTAAPLIGLDVRTPFGLGAISGIFRDEDYPDEAGFSHPSVFVVQVLLSAPEGSRPAAVAFLSPDSVWTKAPLLDSTPSGVASSNTTSGTAHQDELPSSDAKVGEGSADLLDPIVEDDGDDLRDSATSATTTSSTLRRDQFTSKLSSHMLFCTHDT